LIYQNENTPYAQAMAKKEASDSVGALMNSDALIKYLENYITSSTEAQTLLKAAGIICRDYSAAAETKTRLITELTKDYMGVDE